MRFRALNVAVFALLLAAPSVAQGKTGGSARLDDILAGDGFRHVSMETAASNLFVRAAIDGRPAALVIDTGAPFTTLDRNRIATYRLSEKETRLGLESPIGHTSEHVGLSRLGSIEIAKIVLANDAVTVVDLSAMNRGTSIYAVGVFGLSHMRRLGAIIDCAQRILYLNPRGTSRLSESKLDKFLAGRNFVRIPMQLNRRKNPEVDCRINGFQSKITVETAAFTTIVQKQLLRRAGIRQVDAGFTGEGVGKLTAPISSAVATDFSVGVFHTRNQKLFAADAKFGVLGIDYLRAHEAVIDCGGMTLFLRH